MSQIDRNEILQVIAAIVLSIAMGAAFFWLVEQSLFILKILAWILN